jgi:hypothetical protein
LVLVFWAGWYLRGFLDALDDTYYGLSFTYEGQKGPVVGRADELQFDWRTGRIRGRGVTLSQVGAPSVLTVSDVNAFVPLPWTSGEAYVVSAKDGFAELVRYRDGTWSFQDFAPVEEGPEREPVPVELTASDMRLRFHDRYVKQPTTWNIAAEKLKVGALGSDAATSFRGTIDGVGVMAAEFDLLNGSLQYMHVDGKDLDVLPLKRYFGQWEGLSGSQAFAWTADAARFSGKVTARPNHGGDWVIRGEGQALAANIIYDGRRFPKIDFSGGFTENGAGGRIVGSGPGLDVDGVGYLAFGEELSGRIEGTASADSASVIEAMLDDVLPADLDFRGADFDGAISIVGDKVAMAGSLTADRLVYGEYEVSNVFANVASDGKVLRIIRGRGNAFGTTVSADLAITIGKTPIIDGVVRADDVALNRLPGLPRDVIYGGEADIRALISGPASRLVATVHATGTTAVTVNFEDQSLPNDVRFEIAGDYRQGKFFLESGAVGGRLGALQGKGIVDISGGTLDLDVFASGIDLSALPGTSLDGTAYGELKVKGTTGDPIVAGLVEVYGGSLDEYTLPFASAEIRYRGRRLRATDVVARRGVSVIEGDAEIDLRTSRWPITGRGRVLDLMLSEFTGEKISGLANGTWAVSGDFYDPTVDLELGSPSVVADRLEIRDVSARAKWANNAVTLGDFSAVIGGGKLTSTGSWSRTGSSAIRMHLEDASTWALRPYMEGVARLGGRISGDVEVSFLDGQVQRGTAQLIGRDLSVNRENVGGATISAEANSEEVNFSAGIGNLESNYVIENGIYRFADRSLNADFYALGGDIENLMRVVTSMSADASVEQRQILRQIDGTLTAEGNISARFDDSDGLKIIGGRADVRATGLVVQGEPAGDAHFVARREADRYIFETADWTGPQAALRLNPGENFVGDNGRISLDGDIYNIDLNWFKSIRPELANLNGKADVSFIAAGTTEEPEITATIATEGLKYADIAFDMNAGPFLIKNGSITAGNLSSTDPDDPGAGYLRIRDLQASLVGLNLPFEFPATIPRDRPLNALIVVPDKDIDDISEFLGIDPAASEGFVRGGRLEIGGTLDALSTVGGISLEAPRLKFGKADTTLLDVSASADLEGAHLLLAANGRGEEGGTFASDVRMSFDGMVLDEGSFIRTEGLRFAQRFGTDSRASGIFDANLALSGALFEPLVQGKVTATDAAMRIAGEFPAAEGQALLPVNPTFDVELELINGQVANGPIEAQASGTGFLRGPLSVLDAQMLFSVDSGELNLPSSRIRLERGGTANFTYTKNFEGIQEASLDVNLNATTRVTTDAGLGPQRYTISMEITGDLLSDDDLTIRASSDPPDLSQSQILAILGQTDLIQDVTSMGFGRFEDQLKTLLSSVAAPLFIGQISRSIERALGLEYFSVDFTGSGIGGITIAKSLGNGFTLEYRRVLEQFALAGESLEEIRLTYRLPTSNPILGRLTVGVAATREGLLKATLSYSRRF